MENYDIYKDIARRSGGDIYVGVVGPVRTGKSTFISKFVETTILPNISNKLQKQIALDETPQSADGKTVMTSQPKFVPANAVKVQFKNKIHANFRLVDCVGYFVDGALGQEEDGKPRMVKTPWSEEEIPFEKAGEIGTKKVITDYSTIGIVVTTDGSIGEIPRANYIKAEERVIDELKELQKPFVVLLNCKDTSSQDAQKLRTELEEKYCVPVLAINALNLTTEDISAIMEKVLYEFPTCSFDVSLPDWMQSLSEDDEIITSIATKLKEVSKNASKMKDFLCFEDKFECGEDIKSFGATDLNLADGRAKFKIEPKETLFYEVLSKECGEDIDGDYELLSYVKNLSEAKREYKKLKYALECAKETGYGIVEPDEETLQIEEPILTRQSGKYGVKFKASAPSLHILNVDLSTEVSPIVGSKEQSEELINKLSEDYAEDPKKILSTNIFGKTLNELIGDGLKRKATNISSETQGKMRKTVTRIINENKGGVICILL